MREFNFIIIEENVGTRVDKLISTINADISRCYAAKLAEDGLVLANGVIVPKKYKAVLGDEIKVIIPTPVEMNAKAEEINLDIVYEDSQMLIVNKSQGMVVHPAVGNHSGTLVNALMAHCKGNLSQINGVIRPGIVHRIDKNTSGLLLVAKTDKAHNGLAAQIKAHSLNRIYNALVHGNIKEDTGMVNQPIGRNPNDRKKMCIIGSGREAVTHYRVVQRFEGYTLVECKLETGRTHQIRVHMASLGHSVVGDDVYGINPKKERFKLNGQLLHAKTVGFIHPISGEYMEFSSNLPDYFVEVLEKLKSV